MTAAAPTQCPSQDAPPDTTQIDASCRVPLFVLFIGAAAWLVAASVFGLLASLSFHKADLFANCFLLTYGHVHAAAQNSLLYGFAIPAGLGVALWIIARLGGNRVSQPWLIAIGGKIWHLGVLVGVLQILFGRSTGFENFEMPRAAGMILLISYLITAFWILVTLHERRERRLQPSHWFLLAALFWFPWIFSTAYLLLIIWPVRGVMQAVIAWWYSANLNFVWLGLVGLGAAYYFLQKFMNRLLHSQYLALLAFWAVISFVSWSGIPSSAPVPAWMPAMSSVATVLTIIVPVAVAVNVHKTVAGCSCSQAGIPLAGKFLAFGIMMFVLSWLMRAITGFEPVNKITSFTWYTVAQSQLNLYGFFAMTMLAGIYYIVPQVTGIEWPCGNSVRAHYWLYVIGIILWLAPLAVGGILEGIKWSQPAVLPVDVAKGMLPFLRITALGELCILCGNLLLLGNIIRLSVRFWRAHFTPAIVAVTATPGLAEVKP